MTFQAVHPFDGRVLGEYPVWDEARLEVAMAQAAEAAPAWAERSLEARCAVLRQAAARLRERREPLARRVTEEMGKLYREALAEVDKCALVCDYYADHAATFLADESIASDASRSLVAHQPLGTVLAVMPWNFPLWQVFRFAAPALAAGNTGLLKHASNVPGCALDIEAIWRDAGAPTGVFASLMIRASQVEGVIADPRVHAVTLTGSEPAGRAVAAAAGAALKPSVLELGGSDPFIVLADADLDQAAATAAASRYMNAGQSCIAAKRFIVVEAVADAFLERFRAGVEALRHGDPFDEATTLAPLARSDLRDELHGQVVRSIEAGAVAVTGCEPLGHAGYAASILDRVAPGMPAWDEELFGPVATVIRVADEEAALRVANGSRFGLGGSVWSGDSVHGEALARRLECGCAFVNGMVKSDPRLPFGGVKASGYGRELSRHGMLAFVNVKTVWVA